ncbi:MAG: glycogen synthase [Dehalococcoidia bacterium]
MSPSVSSNVLFVIAEMAPLVKVGGLGDVGGALPPALRRLGADVRVALPYYASLNTGAASDLRQIASLGDSAAIWQADARGVPVYLVEHERSFGREQVYGYEDDVARFLTFCDALLAAATTMDWQPDALHLHDWHAGLLATRLVARAEHPWSALPRVSTIHNLGITGALERGFAAEHGLAGEALAVPVGVSPEVALSGLGQSILHADLITTVSPTYAREILTPEYGAALAPLLQQRRDRLSGIINGIDVEEFNPATDPHLAARFDAERLDQRIENKRALQRQLGLPVSDDVPLVGMVARLFKQKGPDLAAAAVERALSERDFQFVLLGTGDPEYERGMTELATRHPERVAVRLAFDIGLGQLIYGGSDLFLMPSRYEPCGLGQLIAMRYGAVPVVRRTGGLADSVQPYDPSGSGTGFLFEETKPAALADALGQALVVYDDRRAWRDLQRRCMAQDFSWEQSARQYLDLYEHARDLASQRAGATEGAR